jgi:hypothetical protein
VLRALGKLGFETQWTREHISLVRHNPGESRTLLTIPNHARIKASTLRTALSRAGVSRDEFLRALHE